MSCTVEYEKYIGSISPTSLTTVEKIHFKEVDEAEEWIDLVNKVKNIRFFNFRLVR